jgi:hypothetical protein
VPNLRLAGDPAADALLGDNPFALLVGMLLDQQVPMERGGRREALRLSDWPGHPDTTTP